jgi:hypothetical protein
MENKLYRLEERLQAIERAAGRLRRVRSSSDRGTWPQVTRDIQSEAVPRLRRRTALVSGDPS